MFFSFFRPLLAPFFRPLLACFLGIFLFVPFELAASSISSMDKILPQIPRDQVDFKILVSPPDAVVHVNGKSVGGEIPTNFQNFNSFREVSLSLPIGEVLIEVSHPHGRSVERRVLFLTGRKVNEINFKIQLRLIYLSQLEEEQYLQEQSSWRWKWGSSLGAGVAVSFFAYSKFQDAKASREKQLEEERALLSTSSSTEAQIHEEKAAQYEAEVQNYNNEGENLSLLSLGLIGLAAWLYWVKDPQKPNYSSPSSEEAHWQPFLAPNQKIGIQYTTSW